MERIEFSVERADEALRPEQQRNLKM